MTRRTLDEFNDVPAPDPDRALWTRLSTITPKPVRFVERPLWQEAAFELLVGEKGCGKGTYLAGLAARVSRGELNGNGKSTVIWIAAGEDSLAMDVWPRIRAADGVLENIIVPQTIELSLPESVEQIRVLALMQEVGLIVIDPVVGLMKNNYSSNADTDVRHVLKPLNALADEIGCLVVGVRHLGKDRSQGAVASVLGSVDWVNIPRAVVAVAVDDDGIRHAQVIAGNRVKREQSSRAFRIEVVRLVELGDGEPVTLAIDVGVGKDVDDVLAAPRSSGRSKGTKTLLLDILDAEGECESDALTARVARELGLSAKTVKNAKTVLKDEGLILFRPGEKNEDGRVLKWMVGRTLAPREDTENGVPSDVPVSVPEVSQTQSLSESQPTEDGGIPF